MMEQPVVKSLRYRFSVDRSVKGVVTPSYTVETVGYSEAEILAFVDSFRNAVEWRFPFVEEAK